MSSNLINKFRGRGSSPTEATLRILCGRAAGMCEFQGCAERLFYDEVTTKKFNAAYIAHIVAANPKGPRGDASRSYELSDKIENLMLMCDRHHRLIDQIEPENFSEEELRAMKISHEQEIEYACKSLQTPKTQIINFMSDIHEHRVSFDYQDTVQAVLPARRPVDQYGTVIRFSSPKPESDLTRWIDLNNELSFEFTQKIIPIIQKHPDLPFDVFALAPIPLLARLGELFGDKAKVFIHPKFRTPNTWSWLSNVQTNTFSITETHNEQCSNTVILILSLSGNISDERATAGIPQYNAIYRIAATNTNVDCIQSEADLSAFWHCYQETLNTILQQYGTACIIRVIPAIPITVAFEIGRRHMPRLHPKTIIYDHTTMGYIETITIGE